ncbi:MAG: carboxypeptidase-like regulatory domain-containing protein [Hymenobacteraceae bacterium]|nr:carboxypeptidase-like regulatory domain-containing protein [Hymenobacteraceae bacterium]
MPVFYSRYWLSALFVLAGTCISSPPATAQTTEQTTTPRPSTTGPIIIVGIVQTTTGEPLPGATVFMRGTYFGTSTDGTGRFRLVIPAGKVADGTSLTLEVSYIGYESLTKIIDPADAQNVTFALTPAATMLGETVIAASRVEQTLAEAPVTIEKMNSIQISRLSSPDVMVGLGNLKGVDVSSSALLMSSVSTRGFNSAKSERVIQLADYIDTQSPSLSVNSGNLLGIPEVDMESVDVLHGPSSALYGANAFNGVVLFNSKDPFVYEGLTARIRGGSRAYADAQIRYAKKFTPRLAAKLNLSYQQANDFMPTNFAAQNKLLERANNSEGSSLGYNAVNRYGDVGQAFSPADLSFAIRPDFEGKTIFMPGFTERDLVADDNRTYGVRIQPTLSYLLNDKVKATAGYRFSRGTTTYQSTSRYRFKNLESHQFFAEVKSDQFFVRAYTTGDDGGDTYDMNFLGAFLQDLAVPGDVSGRTYRKLFLDTYRLAYRPARDAATMAGQTPEQARETAYTAAYTAAAATQLQPGTPLFNEARERLIQDATPGRGALIRPQSRLSDIGAQRNFSLPAQIGLIVGAAYRDFRLGSNGRLFSDTANAKINNYEYGAYAQATKGFMDNRIKLAFAARVDDFKNFKPAFSPRASVTYAIGKDFQHNFRASYSRAFRSPAQLDQYISLDLIRAILIGNVGNGFKGYDLNLRNDPRGLFNVLTDPALLKAYEVEIKPLHLEQVNTVEIGYRAGLTEKMSIDLNVYFSRYNDFIGARRIFGRIDGERPATNQIQAGATQPIPFSSGPARVVQAWTNADQNLDTRGASLGLKYALSASIGFSGSYSYNELTTTDLPADFQTFFNTPKHKFTLGASGAVATDFTYTLNYRWAQGYHYEMPFAVGQLSAPSALDINLGYHLESVRTTFQVGATNVLNTNNIQVYGAPSLGRIVFAGVLVEIK